MARPLPLAHLLVLVAADGRREGPRELLQNIILLGEASDTFEVFSRESIVRKLWQDGRRHVEGVRYGWTKERCHTSREGCRTSRVSCRRLLAMSSVRKVPVWFVLEGRAR